MFNAQTRYELVFGAYSLEFLLVLETMVKSSLVKMRNGEEAKGQLRGNAYPLSGSFRVLRHFDLIV